MVLFYLWSGAAPGSFQHPARSPEEIAQPHCDRADLKLGIWAVLSSDSTGGVCVLVYSDVCVMIEIRDLKI